MAPWTKTSSSIRRNFRPNFGDLLQRQLPCQHRTGHAHVIQSPAGAVVDNARLGGHVNLHVRRKLPCQCQKPQIRQNQRICARLLCLPQKLRERGDLLVAGEGVAGEIDRLSVLVRQRHCLVQLRLAVEIAGGCTHAEALSPQIHRICAVIQRRTEPFQIAGRCQQLRLILVYHRCPPFR